MLPSLIMKKTIICLAILALFPSVVNASEENFSKGKITGIKIEGRWIEVIQENAKYPDKCSNSESWYLFRGADETDDLLKMLLTAYQTDKAVEIGRHYSNSKCNQDNKATIFSVWLR